MYFDWNRGSTRFELLLSKDIIKDLVQALKLEHPAEHMQEGLHCDDLFLRPSISENLYMGEIYEFRCISILYPFK